MRNGAHLTRPPPSEPTPDRAIPARRPRHTSPPVRYDTGMHPTGIPHGKKIGFTLIEVLVAITVLTTVLFAPISIITQYVIESALTESNMRAGLLVQEIIEHVRYDRDSNFLAAGNWFTLLRSPESTVNKYSKCVMTEGAWLRNANIAYCDVRCLDGTTTNDCSTNTGFVDGVATATADTGTRPPTATTCDGAAATDALTATLTIIIPDGTGDTQYASIRPCVSWRDRNDTVHKFETEETLFHWLVK